MKTNRILSIVAGLTLSAWCLMFSPDANGQTTATKTPRHEKVKAGFGVSVVQTQPQFPGGDDSLVSYLRRNVHYPEQARLKKEEGEVFVGFMVDTLGKIRDARVVSSIGEELDAEAMRVIQGMPDWKPGTAGGSPVNVHYIQPIDFVLPRL
jgi:TonB family protein